jgi:hypothetical protein
VISGPWASLPLSWPSCSLLCLTCTPWGSMCAGGCVKEALTMWCDAGYFLYFLFYQPSLFSYFPGPFSWWQRVISSRPNWKTKGSGKGSCSPLWIAGIGNCSGNRTENR